MSGDGRDTDGTGLGQPPSTTPPPSVRAAILARVVQQSIGGAQTPLLDGRYRLLKEIGRGGAGTVWEAELLPLGRRVAVKLLRPGVATSGNAVSRLMREAMTVSKLGHEHIVQVNDVGTDEHGSPYIAMELLDGESLAQVISGQGRLPWPEVAQIATQICDALSAAHAVDVVHRDVKPANVFAIKRDDGRWRCKLLDFGLCTGGGGTTILTAAGALLGTPGYAAPEQIRGEAVDGRADLYGLACVMFELLTGRPAFQGTSRQQIIANQLAGRRATDLDALGISERIVALIDRGLSVCAPDRHDDPAAFAQAIAEARRPRPSPSHEPSDAKPTAAPARFGWGYALGVATTLASAGFFALAPWSSTGEPEVSTPIAATPEPPEPSRPSEPSPPPPLAPPPTLDEANAAPPVQIREPAAAVAPKPTATKPRRAQRPKPRAQPKPRAEPETNAEPEAPSPAPAPAKRRAYAEGIRDPFAGH